MTDARTRATRLLPLHDESAPVVCTLGNDDRADRVALLDRLRTAAIAVERTATGLLLTFDRAPGVEADVRRFAVDEKRCCTFWGFAVVDGDDELVLRWDGPPAAAPVLDGLDAALRGDEPIERIAGIL